MATIILNGCQVEAPEDMTVLQLARRKGIAIPTLCYHDALGAQGACRLCIVEMESPSRKRAVTTSCNLLVAEGMSIQTDTPHIRSLRKLLFELLLGRSPASKPLLEMAKQFGVDPPNYHARSQSDCVQCGLCVRACQNAIGVSAITFSGRGQKRRVTTEYDRASDVCIGCGACANLCPTGMIRLEDHGEERKILINKEGVIGTFKLVRCASCNRPFATDKFLAHVAPRSDGKNSIAFDKGFCPACARKLAAKTSGELAVILG